MSNPATHSGSLHIHIKDSGQRESASMAMVRRNLAS
jgi:hypothetical protein